MNEIGAASGVSIEEYEINEVSNACTDPVIVDAGPDINVCIFGDVSLSGLISGAVTTGQWKGGSGTFYPDRYDLNAVYTPDPGEANIIVVLTLVSDDPGGDCTADSAVVNITVDDAIAVDAGPDIAVCISGSVSLSGIVTGGSATGQ